MDISKDIKELGMAAGIADTFHGRDCCSALDRIEDYIEQLRKRLAELETLIEQANKKIQWYERTEATND